jgi:hypothetical protein
MKRKTQFALTVVLLAVFAAVFAGEAMAKPNWVTVKYTGAALRTNKDKKIDDKNYRSLVLKFDIINNSKSGDIMTSIYDRNINWKGVFSIPDIGFYHNSPSWNVGYTMKGANPIKGEWYPGQVYKYEHSVPLGLLIKASDGWKLTNEGSLKGFKFKLGEWSLDFQVQSHK